MRSTVYIAVTFLNSYKTLRPKKNKYFVAQVFQFVLYVFGLRVNTFKVRYGLEEEISTNSTSLWFWINNVTMHEFICILFASRPFVFMSYIEIKILRTASYSGSSHPRLRV